MCCLFELIDKAGYQAAQVSVYFCVSLPITTGGLIKDILSQHQKVFVCIWPVCEEYSLPGHLKPNTSLSESPEPTEKSRKSPTKVWLKLEHFQQVPEMEDERSGVVFCLLLGKKILQRASEAKMYIRSLGTHFLLLRSFLLKPEQSK